MNPISRRKRMIAATTNADPPGRAAFHARTWGGTRHAARGPFTFHLKGDSYADHVPR
ncbi:hypothetical protein [Paraburkholderia sp. J41]|uniref:hypothetical protein n=1 Tax=Paraburkholderia sp. J41 TaxID=2805433 RepID=UPI002AC36056|nr:hypothetical protein [Paraburkholderia sp. J41]